MKVSQLESKLNDLGEVFRKLPRSTQSSINERNLENSYNNLFNQITISDTNKPYDPNKDFGEYSSEVKKVLYRAIGLYYIDKSHMEERVIGGGTYKRITDPLKTKVSTNKLSELNKISHCKYGFFLNVSSFDIEELTYEDLLDAVDELESELHSLTNMGVYNLSYAN